MEQGLLSSLQKLVEALVKHLLHASALTFLEFFILFGPLLIAALISHVVSRRLEYRMIRLAGVNWYIYLLGWLGTPVHEVGHALMCLFFRHRIVEIRLFKPDKETGTLGYVRHSFNPKSIYQQIGNFFIAIGPILLGGAVLFAAARLLLEPKGFPWPKDTTTGIQSLADIPPATAFWFADIVSGLGRFLGSLDFCSYRTWIFLYLAVAIGAHVNLSPADLASAKLGFLLICVLLLAANIILTLFVPKVPFSVFQLPGRYLGFLSSIVLASAGMLLPLLALMELLGIIRKKGI